MEKYFQSINMDRLHGRMLKMPPKDKANREILLIGGHHTSLERMFGVAETLSHYGAVTMPDLPGFGGMESFYKIGVVPSVDSFADYLAAFVKLHYKRKKFVAVGFSYSVPIVIRMLQKYPELAGKIDFVVSTVGFTHKEDFKLSKKYIVSLKILSKIGSGVIFSTFLNLFIFRDFIIRAVYILNSGWHTKMQTDDKEERKRRIDFEVDLWKKNDLRTWMKTLGEMFNIDVLSQKISTPIHHVTATHDVYFDENVVEQHMRIITDDLIVYKVDMPNHAPSIIATEEDAAPYIPEKLRKVLKRS